MASGAGGAAVAGAGLLAACGTPAQTPGGGTSADTTPDLSDTDKLVNFSNWQLYIDVDDKDPNKRPTLDAFTAKTGIKVNYAEDVNDNSDVLRQGRAAAARTARTAGATCSRSPTGWPRGMIREGLVQTMDQSTMTNYPKNLSPALKSPTWDPTRQYSAAVAVGHDGHRVQLEGDRAGQRRSSELLTRPDLKGKVTCLTEMRDTMGLILLDQGKDPANFTSEDYDAAHRRAADGRRLRPDPAVHGQRLHRRPRQGRHRRVPGLVG